MEKRNHYFFAVKLPDQVKDFFANWVKENKQDFPFQRWVHPQDYHITLAFLGSAEESMLNKAIDLVHNELQDVQKFSLRLNELGTFGSPRQPRIFWADVESSNSLSEIQKKVYNQCMYAGFSLDKKPFRPHITLARKWAADLPFNESLLTRLHLDDDETVNFTVEEIILYETQLNKTPKYYERRKFLLK